MTEAVLSRRELRRIPRGDEADSLALAAYDRLIDLLATLSPQEWEAATRYQGWSVRQTVAHMVGYAGAHASVMEYRRQMRVVEQSQGTDDPIAHVAELQVREHDDLSPGELVARLRARAPRAVEGRTGRREWFGATHAPQPGLEWRQVPGSFGKPLEELCNTTLARDTWIHHLDIAHATDRQFVYSPSLDGALIGDIVTDWCERHDSPVVLELTGPFGGAFTFRRGGPTLRMDALDFCRVMSGRQALEPVPDSALLAVHVPF